MAIPTIFLEVPIAPDPLRYDDIVTRMRETVYKVTKSGVTYGKMFAPGEKLKNDIASTVQDTADGAVGLVWMPWAFIYTLLPGTKPHPIPVGGAKAQQKRGYPLRFYWEKVGRVVSFWSVNHPGYKGTDWNIQVYERVDQDMNEELQKIGEHIAARWAGV